MDQDANTVEKLSSSLSESKVVHFMMNTNCLYLLSVCLLLVGMFLMMHSPILSANPLMKNIQIYAILQIYEILLIIICVLLLKKLHLFKDGLIIAGIEILLFLDPTFFNNVFYSANLAVGLVVNLCCFVLFIVKYSILIRIGGLPHSRRLGAMLIITALFVYFYPVVLSRSMNGIIVDNFYYLLCWLPLLLAILMPSLESLETISAKIPLTSRQIRNLFIAIFFTLNFIIISHLFESLIGYGLDFKATYISPFLLSFCFMFARLKPKSVTSIEGKQIFWVITIIAALFSLFQTEGFAYKIFLSIWISPFRYTILAIIALNFFIWALSKERFYISSLVIWGFFFLSGKSVTVILDHILRFHLAPYLYISGCFALVALFRRRWTYLYLAGLPLFFLALSHLVSSGAIGGYFAICQSMGLWSILVLWRYNHSKRFAMSLAILSFMLLYAFLRSILPEYTEFYILYFWLLIIGSSVTAYLARSRSLIIISLLGILGRILYAGKDQLPEYLKSGFPVLILAFLTLIMGLLVSLLKKRKNIPRFS